MWLFIYSLPAPFLPLLRVSWLRIKTLYVQEYKWPNKMNLCLHFLKSLQQQNNIKDQNAVEMPTIKG